MQRFSFLLILLFIFSSFTVKNKIDPQAGDKPAIEKLVTMKVKEAEKFLGRKMTFKEKIGFKLAQRKFKKEIKKNEGEKDSPGQNAFIVSLIALCSIVIPYLGIVALPLGIVGLVMGINARKKNPDDKKAKTAILLSIIALGLVMLAVIAVAVIIATFSI